MGCHTLTMCKALLIVNLIVFASFSTVRAENNRTFPEGFLIGVSTAAYQTEGAWDADGKGENIWDHWIHTDPSHIKNNDTADVADDYYHSYLMDITEAADLGITHYRFSISWTRILPTGMDTSVNTNGIIYYQRLIDAIVSRGMIPVATLYYYDLPQPLQDIGGWTNPEMVKYFVQYARVAFQYFYQVQYWITFNDPRAICRLGYEEGLYAPGIALDGIGDYLCSYVVLRAHATVYHMYQEEFPHLNASLSISLDIDWSEPASDSAADVEAAERRNLFEFGIYGHPIFIGNWPQAVIDRVGNRSKNENFKRSRLPEFTHEEIDYIKGTADFMALNMYSTKMVSDIGEPEYDDPSYLKDMKANVFLDPSWEFAPNGTEPIVPWGTRKALNWLKTTYNDPEIFITENGVTDDDSWIDNNRIIFIAENLLAILDAMYEDNVRVFGYTVRSFVDGFEWTEGYSQHFGLCAIYYIESSDLLLSVPKVSSTFFNKLATTLRIPDDIPTTTPLPTTTTEGAASKMVLYPSLILLVTYLWLLLA